MCLSLRLLLLLPLLALGACALESEPAPIDTQVRRNLITGIDSLTWNPYGQQFPGSPLEIYNTAGSDSCRTQGGLTFFAVGFYQETTRGALGGGCTVLSSELGQFTLSPDGNTLSLLPSGGGSPRSFQILEASQLQLILQTTLPGTSTRIRYYYR